MQFLAILNRDGGTLRTTDLAALSAFMTKTMEAAGHRIEIEIVRGSEIVAALDRAVARKDIDVVLAGGGDGTISAAAAAIMSTDKALAVLPAGTMNLFARGLGIDLTLERAIEGHARGRLKPVDVATANGRPFVHQFSIGLHARLVQMRSRFEYGSRIGKMWASVRAGLAVLQHPPAIDISLELGDAEIRSTTTGLGISNNLFGEGHLPFADTPDGGVLGIYIAGPANRLQLAWLFLAMTIGRLRETEIVEIHECEGATLTILSPLRRHRCVIDGELATLEEKTVVKIHPKVLNVLVPDAAESAA
ncbi:diacylglycerol kinase family lipid kinase [Aquibium carbonis]|uniref:Diacylglycerol kinase family lipid kinase n=1 Tax=Aquibium carbonis TaxID=2495581 RepID=A0A429YUI0_9HYPH|nr:diacylglycerol kinase family protein [Aquibium carbonis]RST85095.1 diacylglycerol kinase family lipid kinase [Aquibium carbonis]